MNALRNLSHNGGGLHSGLAALAGPKESSKTVHRTMNYGLDLYIAGTIFLDMYALPWCCRDGSSPPPFTQRMGFCIALSLPVCVTVLDVIKVSVVVPCSS